MGLGNYNLEAVGVRVSGVFPPDSFAQERVTLCSPFAGVRLVRVGVDLDPRKEDSSTGALDGGWIEGTAFESVK